MPELSGPSTGREKQSLLRAAGSGVPVLYMSGYSELASASVEESAHFIAEKPLPAPAAGS